MLSKMFGWGWRTGCAGLALLVAIDAGRLEAGPQVDKSEADEAFGKVVPASATSLTTIETLIEEAMEDGTIGVEERKLISSYARRRLNADEAAAVEARLAGLPSTPATLGSPLFRADDAKTAAPASDNACCEDSKCSGWLDNMYIFAAVDSWAGPADGDDAYSNFGTRIGANMGFPLLECHGIGAQFGLSGGLYNFHGRNDDGATDPVGLEETSVERQLFLTAAVFQRANLCDPCGSRISWGFGYDFMVSDNIGEDADEIHIGQWRGQVGYALDSRNEIGIWGTLGDDEDTLEGPDIDVHPINQVSLFCHHKWCNGADTRAYFGFAEEPGELVFGANGEFPMGNCWAVFGGAHYIMPSNSGGDPDSGIRSANRWTEEVWNVSVGVVFYPGGKAISKTVAGHRWMPLMPVADNGSFALETSILDF